MTTKNTAKEPKQKSEKKEIVVITQKDVNEAIEKNPDMRWFILQTYSGKDAAALRSIQERLKTSETEDGVGIIVMAEKKVSVLRNNKLVEKKQTLYPSYLWVLAKVTEEGSPFMDEKVYFAINGSANLIGFTGQNNDQLPQAIRSVVEVKKMVSQLQKTNDCVENQTDFTVGTKVKILDGNFVNLNGTITEINKEKNIVSVSVVLLGAETMVDVSFKDLEVINE